LQEWKAARIALITFRLHALFIFTIVVYGRLASRF